MRQGAKSISALAAGFLSLTVLCRASELTSFDAAERQRVVTGAVGNLRQHYFDREVAQETADALLAHEKNGDDDAAKDGVALCRFVDQTDERRES